MRCSGDPEKRNCSPSLSFLFFFSFSARMVGAVDGQALFNFGNPRGVSL